MPVVLSCGRRAGLVDGYCADACAALASAGLIGIALPPLLSNNSGRAQSRGRAHGYIPTSCRPPWPAGLGGRAFPGLQRRRCSSSLASRWIDRFITDAASSLPSCCMGHSLLLLLSCWLTCRGQMRGQQLASSSACLNGRDDNAGLSSGQQCSS